MRHNSALLRESILVYLSLQVLSREYERYVYCPFTSLPASSFLLAPMSIDHSVLFATNFYDVFIRYVFLNLSPISLITVVVLYSENELTVCVWISLNNLIMSTSIYQGNNNTTYVPASILFFLELNCYDGKLYSREYVCVSVHISVHDSWICSHVMILFQSPVL